MRRRSFIAGALVGAPAGALLGRVAGGPTAASSPSEGRLSFAQQGEDIVLYHVLHDLLKVEAPTYLDVGAADPVAGSNTYLLYCTGGHGVLVEPNPMYVERLRRRRPRDVVVAAGVGIDDAREADYFVIRGRPALNTFSPESVATLRAELGHDPVERVVRMPLVPIDEVIATRLGRAPDLLSIDVEGLDLAVLRTLDFEAHRPGVVIAETIAAGSPGLKTDLVEFVTGKGYAIRGGSMVNTVFVDGRRYG